MASVYYLFDDALHIADDIVHKYSQQDTDLKDHYVAAILIQRAYRGYIVRKNLKIMHKAATTMQKYIRGWLVRYVLPEKLQETYDTRCLDSYHRMATKLQSCWKGSLVRRETNIKQIMEAKRKAQEKMAGFLADAMFEEDEEKKDEEKSIEEEKEEEELQEGGAWSGPDRFFKEMILELLFDRHHLLSTKVTDGVLKHLGEPNDIEEILASLPWVGYMKKLKKMYNKFYKEQMRPKECYLFANKKLQQQEDLLRLRDKSNDKKEERMQCEADERKPFSFNIKPKERPYERSMSLEGPYFVPQKSIVRSEDKTKNICDKEFELTPGKIVMESKVPPYYGDVWYQECSGHNIID